MKKHIRTNLWIALFGLLTLTFAVFSVLEAIPAKGSGILVKEEITVSSSLLNASEKKTYASILSGVVENPTDEPITVDKWTVTVHGNGEKKILLPGATVPPRSHLELGTTWIDVDEFNRVSTVVATVGGVDDLLPNGEGVGTWGLLVICLSLFAVSAGMTVHFSKQRYYMWQEDRMREA